MPAYASTRSNFYPQHVDCDGKDYEILDGKLFLDSYLFYPELPRDHFEYRANAWIGIPGSGKSSNINYVTQQMQGLYGRDLNVLKTDSLHLAIENINEKPMQLLFIDDALAGGQDARRSMSDANVSTTQAYMIIRHACKAKAYEGVVFVMFSYQDLSGIDVRFRRSLHFCFLKSYIDDPKIKQVLHDDEDAMKLLKHVTKRDVLYHDYNLRGIAVGWASWGDLMYLNLPYVSDADVNIPVLSAVGVKEGLMDKMCDWLLSSGILDETNNQTTIQGLLMRKLGDDYDNFSFRSRDLTEIIKKTAAEKFYIDQEAAAEQFKIRMKIGKQKREVKDGAIQWFAESPFCAQNLKKDEVYGLIINHLGTDYKDLGFKSKELTEMYRRARAQYLLTHPPEEPDQNRSQQSSENVYAEWNRNLLILYLRDIHKLEFEQIHAVTGIPTTTVHRIYHRYRSALRDDFEKFKTTC